MRIREWTFFNQRCSTGFSIIGPLLFLIYINDMDLCLADASADMYADDTTFYMTGKNINNLSVKLSDDLKEIHEWCNDNKMVINVDKTKTMIISSQQRFTTLTVNVLTAQIDGLKLKTTNLENLLGIKIDCNLTWTQH